MVAIIIAVVITLVVVAPVTLAIANSIHKKQDAETISGAQEQARRIIDEAVTEAQAKKREALLEAKEDSLKTKNDLEKEIRERRAEVQRSENRILQREENIDKKSDALARRERSLHDREQNIEKAREEVAQLNARRLQELERISGLTSEQAKEYLLKTVEEDVKIDAAKIVKESVAQAKDEANKRVREIVVTAIQKCAVDHVAEATISVVRGGTDY